MNYEVDLRCILVLLFLDSEVASNNFVEVPGPSGFTGNFSLFSAWDFEENLLLLAVEDLEIHQKGNCVTNNWGLM